MGKIGQILGTFMITPGLSCDRVGFGHFFKFIFCGFFLVFWGFFGGGSDYPPPPPPPPPATGLV